MLGYEGLETFAASLLVSSYQYFRVLLGDVGVVSPWCQRIVIHEGTGFFVELLQKLPGLVLHLSRDAAGQSQQR